MFQADFKWDYQKRGKMSNSSGMLLLFFYYYRRNTCFLLYIIKSFIAWKAVNKVRIN